MPNRHPSLHALGLAAILAAAGGAPAFAQGDDQFISGYAAAIVAREFELANALVKVQEGAVTIDVPVIDDASIPRLRTAIESIPGVIGITINETGTAAPPAPGGEAPPVP